MPLRDTFNLMHISQILPYLLWICLFFVVLDLLLMLKSITRSLEILAGRGKRGEITGRLALVLRSKRRDTRVFDAGPPPTAATLWNRAVSRLRRRGIRRHVCRLSSRASAPLPPRRDLLRLRRPEIAGGRR